MKLTTILFDLDETLMEEEASNEASARAVCEMASARVRADPQALRRAMRARSRELWGAGPGAGYCRMIGISSREGLWGTFAGDDPNLGVLRRWAPSYCFESWSFALKSQGVDDRALAAEMAEAFVVDRRARHVVFPESPAVLAGLRGFRLGLVTDGAPDIQRAKVEGSRLGGYFAAVIISGEIGAGKPDARIFRTALERLGAAPESTVMVGDSLRRDIAGARGAGMRAIWINRAGHAAPDGGAAFDAEMRTLDELPEILARLSGR